MKHHTINTNNFGDAYLLYYGAGCMGDFLASLILHSFNKSFLPKSRYNGPDTFYYEPWSKKWVVRDSTNDLLRTYLLKRRKSQPFQNVITDKDLAHEFNINSTTIGTRKELADFLVTNIDHTKNTKVPYLFVSENLAGIYANVENNLPIQNLPDITVIEAQFFNKQHRPLYFLLSLYKHKLCNYDLNRPPFIDRETFIKHSKNILTVGWNFPLKDKIVQSKAYYKIDMIKLLLEEDNQGLDIVSMDDIEIKNMINIARRDMFEILNFYELDIDNLPEFNEEKLNEVYGKVLSLK